MLCLPFLSMLCLPFLSIDVGIINEAISFVFINNRMAIELKQFRGLQLKCSRVLYLKVNDNATTYQQLLCDIT